MILQYDHRDVKQHDEHHSKNLKHGHSHRSDFHKAHGKKISLTALFTLLSILLVILLLAK